MTVEPLIILPTKGKASINGSLLFGITEKVMRDPYRDPLTLEITLQNDSWVEEVGMGNNPATRALAAGITASAANRNTGNCQKYDQYGTCILGGWMDVVQPALLLKDGYKAITRVSETLVRVLFRSYPYYDVVAPDLIHVYPQGGGALEPAHRRHDPRQPVGADPDRREQGHRPLRREDDLQGGRRPRGSIRRRPR